MSAFTINVPDEAIRKLKTKLDLATFPDELETDNPWTYGAPLQDVKRLAQKWKDDFDWRKAEAELNELPNYRTTITVDGFGPLEIHYVYQPSPNKNAIPLLFSHGCKLRSERARDFLTVLQGPAHLSRSKRSYLS